MRSAEHFAALWVGVGDRACSAVGCYVASTMAAMGLKRSLKSTLLAIDLAARSESVSRHI